jgi:branched-subunit amino acid transport protein
MVNGNYFLLNVVALTIGTIAIRGSFIALSGKMKIPAKVKDLFTYIPAAILPALIVPVSFFHQGQVAWLEGKERFVILLIASIACYFIRNTLFVISLGLILLYLVRLS